MEIKDIDNTIDFVRAFGTYRSAISGLRVEIDSGDGQDYDKTCLIRFFEETMYEAINNKTYGTIKLDMYGGHKGLLQIISYKLPDTTWR